MPTRWQSGWTKPSGLLDHTRALGAPALTSHIGIVPKDANAPRRRVFREAMEAVGTYAEQTGMHFGIETGPEPASVLLDLIDSIDTTGIKINLDPANFITWAARIAKQEGAPMIARRPLPNPIPRSGLHPAGPYNPYPHQGFRRAGRLRPP